MIHPTAIVHPKAKLDSSVRVGPYAVIDEDVEVGPGCVIGPHVYLTGRTTIGSNNKFFPGCVIGEAPQDLKYKGEPSQLRIGDRNTFREHCTIHRANKTEDATIIGTQNLLMAHCHIAHDCQIGNYVIVVNGALVGGHVILGDRALISGNCLLHQFVRVGSLALMQGGSAISKDLPPYTVARDNNRLCGLNTLGLRRAGFTAEQRLELRQLYRTLFRDEANLRTALTKANQEFSSPAARVLLDFIATAGKRGVVSDPGKGPEEADAEEE